MEESGSSHFIQDKNSLPDGRSQRLTELIHSEGTHVVLMKFSGTVNQNLWSYTQSIRHIGGLMGGRMFPLTLDGLDGAMKVLAR